jgi:1-deoxy-D-xylulose-5-phosphate reductoisomerase
VPSTHIAILGSTGSIGTAALDVLSTLGDPWRATALTTHSRIDLLIEQARRFKVPRVVVTGPEPTPSHRATLKSLGCQLLLGEAGLREVAAAPEPGTVLAAIVGAAGLPPVLAAVAHGKRIALANKESLVIAGSLLMPLARSTGAEILPVDSEHSAIFQALASGKRSEVRKLILTASGGPFRSTPAETMAAATAAQALDHPTWKMGGKITIDSATLFNKAFEMLEARWLFDIHPDSIEIVIHPQSIVHSMVEFNDGSTLAQLSPPDMRLPIQYALTYPDRAPCPSPPMDWTRPHTLTFEPPDRLKFPSLDLAFHAARTDGPSGGTLSAVMNAANEVAVEAFLAGHIRFGRITPLVAAAMDHHQLAPLTHDPTLEQLLAADAAARAFVRTRLAQ